MAQDSYYTVKLSYSKKRKVQKPQTGYRKDRQTLSDESNKQASTFREEMSGYGETISPRSRNTNFIEQ